MIMVATQNFRSVDRLLAAPGRAGAQVETMGHDAARAFLRYQVSEQNRWYFERFYMTPEIIRLGRLIDFVPPAASSPERDTFWRFHGAYSAVELLKLALGFLLAGRLIFGRKRIGNQVDVVDEADHSHIDR